MTAKEYLSQAIRLRRRVNQCKQRIMEIREMSTFAGTIRYDKDNIQSSPSNDQMVNFVIRLEHEEQQYQKAGFEYLRRVYEIRSRIGKVTPQLYADILYMRYIDGMDLLAIADDLNYSYDWVRHLHGVALQKFRHVFPEYR